MTKIIESLKQQGNQVSPELLNAIANEELNINVSEKTFQNGSQAMPDILEALKENEGENVQAGMRQGNQAGVNIIEAIKSGELEPPVPQYPDYFYIECPYGNIDISLKFSEQSSAQIDWDSFRQYFNFEYSFDKEIWTPIIIKAPDDYTTDIAVETGERVYIRGNNTVYGFYYNQTVNVQFHIVSTYLCGKVGGDINTLINLEGGDILLPEYCFHGAFVNAQVDDFRELKIPSTVLSRGCFSLIFKNSYMAVSPVMNFEYADDYSLQQAFFGCLHLSSVKLKIVRYSDTTLVDMFTYASDYGVIYTNLHLQIDNLVRETWVVMPFEYNPNPEYFYVQNTSTQHSLRFFLGYNDNYQHDDSFLIETSFDKLNWERLPIFTSVLSTAIEDVAIVLQPGQKIYFRGYNHARGLCHSSNAYFPRLRFYRPLSGSFPDNYQARAEIGGDINTLVNVIDRYIGIDISLPDYCFSEIFRESCLPTSINGLKLFASTAPNYCYARMFFYCLYGTSLTFDYINLIILADQVGNDALRSMFFRFLNYSQSIPGGIIECPHILRDEEQFLPTTAWITECGIQDITFVKHPDAVWPVTDDGVDATWNVIDSQ